MAWWQAVREVWRYEWMLLARHPKLAVAAAGLLFVPALYALIYLWSMWDPAAHTRVSAGRPGQPGHRRQLPFELRLSEGLGLTARCAARLVRVQ